MITNKSSSDTAPILIIIAASAAAFMYYFVGFYLSDDLQYTGGIRLFAGLPDGRIVDLGSLRFVLILPSALFAWLGGSIEWSFLSQFAYFAGTGILCYALTKDFADRNTAIATSITCLSIPSVIIFSPSLLPDIVLSFYLLLHAFLIHRAATKRHDRPFSLLLLAGISAGAIYASKEAATIYLLPWFIYMAAVFFSIGLTTTLKGGLYYTSGIALIVALDLLLQYAVTGELLPRLFGGMDAAQAAKNFMDTQGHSPSERLTYALSRLDRSYPFLLLLSSPLFLGATAILSRPKKDKYTFACMLYFGGIWIFTYNTFGSISAKEFIGVPIQERYYSISAIFLMMSSIIFLNETIRIIEKKTRSAILVTILTMISLWQIISTSPVAGSIYGASVYRSTVLAVKTAGAMENLPVYFEDWLYHRTRYGTLNAVLPMPANARKVPDCRFWLVTTKEPEMRDTNFMHLEREPLAIPLTRAYSIATEFGLVSGRLRPAPIHLYLVKRNDCGS